MQTIKKEKIASKPSRPGKKLQSRTGIAGVFHELMTNRVLYLMVIPALVWLLMFQYIPMYGIQLAFKKFNFGQGILGSKWNGLDNFKFFFKSIYFPQVTRNTLFINLVSMAFSVISQVGVALLLNEVLSKHLKKGFQTAMFFPYFISWVAVSIFVHAMLSERYGMLNSIIRALGGEGSTWYNMPQIWPWILIGLNVWKGLGYNVVIYLARITSIDQELYEAARIDGCNKFQEITKITLPMLIPTIIMLVILGLGGMFRGNLDMILSVVGDNGVLLETTEVIDTYVYRAMRINNQYGMAAAVGLVQSVLGLILVSVTNWLVKKYDKEMGLF